MNDYFHQKWEKCVLAVNDIFVMAYLLLITMMSFLYHAMGRKLFKAQHELSCLLGP